MRKSRTLTKSKFKAKIKKRYKGELPTQKMYDPFLKTWIYYNKNGRTIAYRNYRWEAI